MDNNSGVVILDSSKEKNEKLKKRWSTVNSVANVLTTASTSGFVVSLLSPFDFEGPVIEIVTAVLAAVGFIMKKVSTAKLENIEENNILDDDDKKTLLTVTKNLGKAKEKQAVLKARR